MAPLRGSKPLLVAAARPLRLDDGQVVAVHWVRDARARRLRLLANERGVRLTLPLRASVELAERFLAEQDGWLQAQLAKRSSSAACPFSPETEVALWLRGERLAIDWCEGRFARVELSEHGVRIAHPPGGNQRQLRSALRDFYSQQARIDIGRWLPKYLATLPRVPTAFRVRPLSSLWGSLSPNNALSLDLSLVLGRASAFEYVLVHELCHLLQRNHSSRFWREVEARCPDWRAERDYLRGEGLGLKAELRRWLVGRT